MRRRFSILVPALLLVAALFFGISMLGRNAARQGQNGANLQSRNLVGYNQPGSKPNTVIGVREPTGMYPTPAPGYMGARPQIKHQTGFDSQKADNLRARLGEINGIRQINAVVNGNTALISYSSSNKTNNANATRRMITDKVKQLDKTITNVVASDSADFSTQLRRLMDNINSSKPMEELNSEFNQLAKKIGSIGL